jgi:hypothetical protein
MSSVIQNITDRRAYRQPPASGSGKKGTPIKPVRAPTIKMETNMATADKSMIENFRDKARIFIERYEKLKRMDADVRKYPALHQEYTALVGKGTTIRNSVRTVTGGIDNVVGWFNSIFGNDQTPQLDGLGLLPLIPVAVVIASVAAMGKWGSDVYLFERRLNEAKRLENTGMTPGEAAKIVGEREPPGLIAGVTREVMVPLSIAGVLIAGLIWMNRGR